MKGSTRLILAVGGVAVLIVGWYLLSPLFIDRVVQEQLPFQPAQATEAMSEAMEKPDVVMEDEMPAADLTILAQGEFYDLAHEGMGLATVYQLADASRVLRFENFEVLNGPDLHVWLVPLDPVPNTVGQELTGYADLGALKGNIGDQNYEIPANVMLDDFRSVVIWCVPFRVPFNAAPLGLP